MNKLVFLLVPFALSTAAIGCKSSDFADIDLGTVMVGTYSVAVLPNAVANVRGDASPAGTIGTFKVTLGAAAVGTLDPGFILHPNEKIRLVTGTPSKKAHGTPPEEKGDVKNYHLFLREPVLTTPGMVVRVSLKQQELAKAVYAPKSKTGIEEEE